MPDKTPARTERSSDSLVWIVIGVALFVVVMAPLLGELIADPDARGFVRDLAIGPPELDEYDRVTTGMTREEVEELLGEPAKASAGGTTYEQYGLKLMSRRELSDRVATAGGVYAYASERETAVCYVFFDAEGRVVDVFIAVAD